MTCKDCYFYENQCLFQNGKEFTVSDRKCFKDKTRIVDLPWKPLPMVMYSSHSDAYCPFCGENLSGYYGDCNAPDILPCFNCGKWLDNTKSMSIEEAKQALKEREKP